MPPFVTVCLLDQAPGSKDPDHLGDGPIGSGPWTLSGPCGNGAVVSAPALYQGLAMHSSSVPDADAWHCPSLSGHGFDFLNGIHASG